MPYSVILLFNSYVLILYDVKLCFDMFCYLILYYVVIYIYIYIWSQTSDNMDRWKRRGGRVREEKRDRRERVRRKTIQVGEKERRKSRNTVFFQCFGSGRSKRLAKAVGAEPCGQMRNEKLRAVVARRKFRSQNVKSTSCSSTFGSGDVEILPGVAHVQVKMYKTLQVRSTFGSWALGKSARRCGAKHMSKSTCTKLFRPRERLEVEMFKKCTQLWREAKHMWKSTC